MKYAPSDFDLPLGTNILEILVTEDQDLSLGCVEGKLVETRFAKLTDLYALDNGSQVRIQILGFSVLEQVWFRLVSARTRVNVISGQNVILALSSSRVKKISHAHQLALGDPTSLNYHK